MKHVEQYTREWLKTAPADEINAARKAGHLAEVIGTKAPADTSGDGQLTREDLKQMTNDQIEEARRTGRLSTVLGGEETN